MQKSTVIIISTCLLSAVGVGAYELGAHKPSSELSTTYSVQTQPAPTTVPATAAVPPAATAIPDPVPSNRLTGNTNVPAYDPTLNTMPVQTAATRTTTSTTTNANTAPLSAETPMAALPPVPGNQYAQESTVTQTKTVIAPAPHRAYVHHYTSYRRHDKVHVGRAVKHTGMFALKLPGRMSL